MWDPQGMVHFIDPATKNESSMFEAFFEDTKWSLWWLPEVNNMCRVRALGSRAAGEKMGVPGWQSHRAHYKKLQQMRLYAESPQFFSSQHLCAGSVFGFLRWLQDFVGG